MKKQILSVSTIGLLLTRLIAPPKAIAADTCNYNLGSSSTGQTTQINLCSIQRRPNGTGSGGSGVRKELVM